MPRTKFHLPGGLRGRLRLAFAGIGALAAVAAAAGFFALRMVGDALDGATAPLETIGAAELPEHAERLVGIGPALLDTTDADQVSALTASKNAELASARRQLLAIQPVGGEAASLRAIVALLARLNVNADAIAAAVMRRNKAASKKAALVQQALIASQQFATILRRYDATRNYIEPVAELQQRFTSVSRLLVTAAGTDDGQRLEELKTAADADMRGIHALVLQLDAGSPAVLSTPLGLLRHSTLGSGGLFAVRRSELEAIAAARALIAENAGLADQLSNEMRQVVPGQGQTNAAARRAIAIQFIVTAALAVIAVANLIVWFFVSRNIASRLTRLGSAMAAIVAGRFDVSVDDHGDDEIGTMSRALVVFCRHAIELDALRTQRSTTAQRPERPVEVEDRAPQLAGDETALRIVLDNIDQGFAIFDQNRNLVAWSRPFRELMRLPDSFLQSRPSFDDFSRLAAWRGESGKIAAGPSADDSPLFREWTWPDGTTLELRCNPISNGSFVSMCADVTERKRAEAEIRKVNENIDAAFCELQATQAKLIRSERMASLGHLAAGIAREIKNPLNLVNNLAGVTVEVLGELTAATGSAAAMLTAAQREKIEQIIATVSDNLERIAQHGKGADGLVESMLAYSRASKGERQSVDINALVEEALNLAYHDARARDQSFNVTVERDFDPGIGPIEVVPQDLSRVFVNLFNNGFYAAAKDSSGATVRQPRPVLKVTTRDRVGEIEVRVRDNGIGMPLEVRDKLFQPFFTTKPNGEGAGLGLSISYDIVVHEYGGSIVVDSRPGEFTEFAIRIPYNLPHAALETAA